jgi:hypothetical protein
MLAGMKSFFSGAAKKKDKESKLRRRERSHTTVEDSEKLATISTDAKKLPHDFADQVLNLELKIDSGEFDIEVIDRLMQLYSVSISF